MPASGPCTVLEPSAHNDTFTRDHLPPRELRPEMNRAATPELAAYPARMNCAAALLDAQAQKCRGERYLDDIERQKAYVQDGWSLTDDSYRRDGDGYYWYEARTDDMIVAAGYNVSSALVEELPDLVKAEIAPYKYPRTIEFVASLPRTEIGKLQHYKLREQEQN